MSNPFHASSVPCCPGPQHADRRGFMRMGLAGFASLSLPGILKLRAENPLEKGRREDSRDHGLETGRLLAHRHL